MNLGSTTPGSPRQSRADSQERPHGDGAASWSCSSVLRVPFFMPAARELARRSERLQPSASLPGARGGGQRAGVARRIAMLEKNLSSRCDSGRTARNCRCASLDGPPRRTRPRLPRLPSAAETARILRRGAIDIEFSGGFHDLARSSTDRRLPGSSTHRLEMRSALRTRPDDASRGKHDVRFVEPVGAPVDPKPQGQGRGLSRRPGEGGAAHGGDEARMGTLRLSDRWGSRGALSSRWARPTRLPEAAGAVVESEQWCAPLPTKPEKGEVSPGGSMVGSTGFLYDPWATGSFRRSHGCLARHRGDQGAARGVHSRSRGGRLVWKAQKRGASDRSLPGLRGRRWLQSGKTRRCSDRDARGCRESTSTPRRSDDKRSTCVFVRAGSEPDCSRTS